jgi:hypothetical protein
MTGEGDAIRPDPARQADWSALMARQGRIYRRE